MTHQPTRATRKDDTRVFTMMGAEAFSPTSHTATSSKLDFPLDELRGTMMPVSSAHGENSTMDSEAFEYSTDTRGMISSVSDESFADILDPSQPPRIDMVNRVISAAAAKSYATTSWAAQTL